jgi:hypothetical protein
MYGVLRGNGEIIPLPEVQAARIQDEDLICYDAQEREVARFPSNGSTFGELEALERILTRLERLEAYRRLERLTQHP